MGDGSGVPLHVIFSDRFAFRLPGFGPLNMNAHNPEEPGTPMACQGAMFSTCPTERSPWRLAVCMSWMVAKLAGMESDVKQWCLHSKVGACFGTCVTIAWYPSISTELKVRDPQACEAFVGRRSSMLRSLHGDITDMSTVVKGSPLF